MNAETAYAELLHRSKERSVLGSCAALLGWDEQTYMPRGGAEHRANQQALLAGLVHEKGTEARIGELLDVVQESDLVADPLSARSVNVREWRRDFDRSAKLPRDLVEELAHATTIGQQTWVEAKQSHNYPLFQPALETIIKLKRREAACLGRNEADYDALLDDYEPNAKTAELSTLFIALRRELVPLIGAIAGAPRRPDTSVLKGDFCIERQRIFAEAMAAAVGFDFERGRLDVTAHPFCTEIGPGDCRITTRYDAHDFTDGFFSVLHETGHALYEQGFDPAHQGTPMGQAVSLGIHESQSRLWENAVGRSLEFWKHAFPLAKRIFHNALSPVTLDKFHAAINHVEPSLIRVQADELTYNLHIIIRFELEQELLSRNLSVADLPAAWSDKYEQYLNIRPENDAEGCLQDVHWSAGLFGYFPTYTLGNVYGAQLFAKASAAVGDLPAQLAAGNFQPLLEWLRTNIHAQGRRFHAAALIRQATGSDPDPSHLVSSLRTKAEALFDL